jgi:glycosyltransferase involved in cell wall biosynthesis
MSKILHICTDDIKYGASRAANRLHQSLLKKDIDSRMCVLTKYTSDHTVTGPRNVLDKGAGLARPVIDSIPLNLLYMNRPKTPWSTNWLPGTELKRITRMKPDVVHLHWIGGMLSIPQLTRFRVPVVWTFHDMWGFTGGCHYAGGCTRYRTNCGECPQLRSSRPSDLSRWIWNRKERHWRGMNLTIVTPSRWMAERVRESRLMHDRPVHPIPNCLDLQTYQMVDKTEARTLLKLPPEKKLLLFGAVNAASDERKGFQYLRPALQSLSRRSLNYELELVVFGASESPDSPQMGFKTHYMGTLSDDVTLALLYSAADVFIAPSVQDNLPNTVLEATACGTPSVAFNIGGMRDLIEHIKTGYLAQPFSTDDLAEGIMWILEESDRYLSLSHNARQKAEREFSPDVVAKKHINLYHDIVHHSKGL